MCICPKLCFGGKRWSHLQEERFLYEQYHLKCNHLILLISISKSGCFLWLESIKNNDFWNFRVWIFSSFYQKTCEMFLDLKLLQQFCSNERKVWVRSQFGVIPRWDCSKTKFFHFLCSLWGLTKEECLGLTMQFLHKKCWLQQLAFLRCKEVLEICIFFFWCWNVIYSFLI